VVFWPEQAELLVALDAALRRLGTDQKELSDIVEGRFLGSMSTEDTADTFLRYPPCFTHGQERGTSSALISIVGHSTAAGGSCIAEDFKTRGNINSVCVTTDWRVAVPHT